MATPDRIAVRTRTSLHICTGCFESHECAHASVQITPFGKMCTACIESHFSPTTPPVVGRNSSSTIYRVRTAQSVLRLAKLLTGCQSVVAYFVVFGIFVGSGGEKVDWLQRTRPASRQGEAQTLRADLPLSCWALAYYFCHLYQHSVVTRSIVLEDQQCMH